MISVHKNKLHSLFAVKDMFLLVQKHIRKEHLTLSDKFGQTTDVQLKFDFVTVKIKLSLAIDPWLEVHQVFHLMDKDTYLMH